MIVGAICVIISVAHVAVGLSDRTQFLAGFS
jgi:hypothetical protein